MPCSHQFPHNHDIVPIYTPGWRQLECHLGWVTINQPINGRTCVIQINTCVISWMVHNACPRMIPESWGTDCSSLIRLQPHRSHPRHPMPWICRVNREFLQTNCFNGMIYIYYINILCKSYHVLISVCFSKSKRENIISRFTPVS